MLAGAIAAIVAAILVFRRRAASPASPDLEPVVADEPVPPLAAGVRFLDPAPVPALRAHLSMTLRPTRAGLNLLSALVEAELTLTNDGDAPAEAVHVVATLTSAQAGQDAEVLATAAADTRPIVPRFTLAAGEARTVRVVAAQPRDAVQPLMAGGRPMLVPLLVIDVRYASGGDARQLAQSFAIGIERGGAGKLAPFWLDQPPRTVIEVAGRSHGTTIDR